MKKTLLFLVVVFSARFAAAQFYIAPSYSYSLPVMKHAIADDFIIDPNGMFWHSMQGSFGGGTGIGGKIGCRLPNGLVIEFNAESFRSNTVSAVFSDSTSPSFNVTCEREAQITGMRFTPKIGYAVGRDKLTLSFTSGVVISTGLNMNMKFTELHADPSSPSWYTDREENYFGNTALGVHTAAGVTYRFWKGFYTSGAVWQFPVVETERRRGGEV
jgi:hypothetical protein